MASREGNGKVRKDQTDHYGRVKGGGGARVTDFEPSGTVTPDYNEDTGNIFFDAELTPENLVDAFDNEDQTTTDYWVFLNEATGRLSIDGLIPPPPPVIDIWGIVGESGIFAEPIMDEVREAPEYVKFKKDNYIYNYSSNDDTKVEYTTSINENGTLFVKYITITLSTGAYVVSNIQIKREEDTGWQTYATNFFYRRKNGIVEVNLGGYEWDATTTVLGTLPTGYRPSKSVYGIISDFSGVKYGVVRLATNGEVKIFTDQITTAGQIYGSVSGAV